MVEYEVDDKQFQLLQSESSRIILKVLEEGKIVPYRKIFDEIKGASTILGRLSGRVESSAFYEKEEIAPVMKVGHGKWKLREEYMKYVTSDRKCYTEIGIPPLLPPRKPSREMIALNEPLGDPEFLSVTIEDYVNSRGDARVTFYGNIMIYEKSSLESFSPFVIRSYGRKRDFKKLNVDAFPLKGKRKVSFGPTEFPEEREI